MAYKVITTAKRSGVGTLSREFAYVDNPVPEELRRLRNEAKEEFSKVYGNTPGVTVDVTVRKAAS